jgi:thiamine kinase-like enzyme
MEEYGKGSPATFEDVVQLVSSAHSLYRATVRVRALARSAHNQKIIERLREMLRRLAPRLAPIPYDAVWLTVLAHGDLLAHNLIHGADGRVWIVDWEKAGINPLGFDLGRLYLRYPQLKERLLALIEELTVHRGVLSPLGQLALGAAFALKWRDFMRQTVVGEAVKMFGNNPATAAAEYDLGTMAARKAVAALAD